MLSGTASWLNLTLMEMLGIAYEGDKMTFDPILPEDMTEIAYTLTTGETVINVKIEKGEGFVRSSEASTYTLDGVPFDRSIVRPSDGKTHEIVIKL
jgi:cellobiose phosphorylase